MFIFTAFVVLTGGFYPALRLVSSNVFGLNLFSSGLTNYKLKKLTKIKIYSSVLLENVPQLVFQAIYSVKAGLNTTVMFAGLASLSDIK